MHKPVSGFTTAFALAISFGLIWLGVSGVDVHQLSRAFFGFVGLVLAGGFVIGFISGLLR
jgi:hypothetical protein